MTLNLSLFQFLRIAAIAAVLGVSFVSCGILDLSGKDEKKEQTEEPKKEQPGGEEPGGNQPGNQPGGNQPGGNNPGGGQPGGNPGGETPGEGEEPGGQQEVARQQGPQTIDISKGGSSINTTVTGFVTDSQWAAAVPKLKNAIVGGSIAGANLRGIFMGTPPPLVISKIVLEKNPGYPKYKYTNTSKEISFNVDYLINTDQNTLNNELSGILLDLYMEALSKVDARDTVRMAKAPVNGKAFAARDTRRYWLGYFLLET